MTDIPTTIVLEPTAAPLRFSPHDTMRSITAICLVVLGLYGGCYAGLRCSHSLIRCVGREGYCWMRGGDWLPSVAYRPTLYFFEPAWILERKTRSLGWRIRNAKPLFGHVYYKGTEK